MATATVVVQYVNPVKPGKKNGSIKSKDGVYYGVPPGMLSRFEKGGTYEIEYSSSEWNNQTYHTVSKIVSASAPAAGSGGGSSVSAADKESMFVYGMLTHAVGAQALDIHNVDEIATLGRGFREAYKKIWGAPATPGNSTPKRDDMDDEIPF